MAAELVDSLARVCVCICVFARVPCVRLDLVCALLSVDGGRATLCARCLASGMPEAWFGEPGELCR